MGAESSQKSQKKSSTPASFLVKHLLVELSEVVPVLGGQQLLLHPRRSPDLAYKPGSLERPNECSKETRWLGLE